MNVSNSLIPVLLSAFFPLVLTVKFVYLAVVSWRWWIPPSEMFVLLTTHVIYFTTSFIP